MFLKLTSYESQFFFCPGDSGYVKPVLSLSRLFCELVAWISTWKLEQWME